MLKLALIAALILGFTNPAVAAQSTMKQQGEAYKAFTTAHKVPICDATIEAGRTLSHRSDTPSERVLTAMSNASG